MDFDKVSTRSKETSFVHGMALEPYIPTLREYEDLEFVSELFGKPLIDILDKLYNQHSIVFYRILDGFAQYLKINTSLEPSRKEQLLKEVLPRLEVYVEDGVDRNFNIFQQYFFDNIVHIPDDPLIVGDHYKDLDMNVTDEDLTLLDEEIENMQKQVITEMAFKHWLTKEQEAAEQWLNLEQEYYKQLDFMNPMMKEAGVTNLDDEVHRVMSTTDQLEHLMQINRDELERQQALSSSENAELQELIDSVMRYHLDKTSSSSQ